MANSNRRVKSYRELEASLPEEVLRVSEKAFALFEKDPNHPSLDLKQLKDNAKGRHKNDSFRVKVNHQYRAIYVEDNGVNLWYWIGTKNDFKNFTGVQG